MRSSFVLVVLFLTTQSTPYASFVSLLNCFAFIKNKNKIKQQAHGWCKEKMLFIIFLYIRTCILMLIL